MARHLHTSTLQRSYAIRNGIAVESLAANFVVGGCWAMQTKADYEKWLATTAARIRAADARIAASGQNAKKTRRPSQRMLAQFGVDQPRADAEARRAIAGSSFARAYAALMGSLLGARRMPPRHSRSRD